MRNKIKVNQLTTQKKITIVTFPKHDRRQNKRSDLISKCKPESKDLLLKLPKLNKIYCIILINLISNSKT